MRETAATNASVEHPSDVARRGTVAASPQPRALPRYCRQAASSACAVERTLRLGCALTAMSAGDASLGVLRPAALDGARPASVEVASREPLRWLASAPEARRGADGDASSAERAAASAAGGGDLVYVHFEDSDTVRLDAGSAFEFTARGRRLAAPIAFAAPRALFVRFAANGARCAGPGHRRAVAAPRRRLHLRRCALARDAWPWRPRNSPCLALKRLLAAGRWEEALGTCVVFTEEAAPAAAAGAPPRRVRHAGHTETRLVMRRALPPADGAT